MNQEYEESELRLQKLECRLNEQFQLIQELGVKVIDLEAKVRELQAIDHDQEA